MVKHIPKLILLFSLFCLTSCYYEKFDSAKWIPLENGLYGEKHRKKMLYDLVNNVLQFERKNYKGTSKREVRKLIGEPNQINKKDGTEIYYIEEKIGMIDPNGYVNLHLIYSNDSTLTSWKIEDVNYKE